MSVQRIHRNGPKQRERVLQAAMEAIADVGVDKLRMTHIAERAGMTPGHILYYFGRKDRILIETLRWSEADLETRRRKALEMAPDPLRTFVELYLPQAQDDVRWRLWTQVWSRPPADPETLEVLETLTWSWRDDLAPILGDQSAATALCYLLDGLTLDVLTGARSRDDAIELGLDAAARYAG